jgi:hypothetical protein
LADLETTTTTATSLDDDEKKPRLFRVRFTINLLTIIVTMSYVLTGAWRVFAKFIQSIAQTSSVSSSFAAAVEVQEGNEVKIIERIADNKQGLHHANRQQQQQQVHLKINGQEEPPSMQGLEKDKLSP